MRNKTNDSSICDRIAFKIDKIQAANKTAIAFCFGVYNTLESINIKALILTKEICTLIQNNNMLY